MVVSIDKLLKSLWILCLLGAVFLTIIYMIFVGYFDVLYYQMLAVLTVSYIPYTICYRFINKELREYLLFFHICFIAITMSYLLVSFNAIVLMFIPVFSILFNKRLIFYTSLIISLVSYLILEFLFGDGYSFDLVAELSLLFAFFLILNVVLNVTVKQSKISYLFEKTVNTLIMAVEAKDDYTQGHSIRVSDYAMIIGKYMRKKGYKINLENLRIASVLHDIGKVKIPAEILTKPGKLTTEEYDCIKKHSLYGAKMAEELEYPKEIVSDILHHHERFDGKGYPDGLKGNKTPINSQIIAIADTFDAITSNRSYRDACTVQKAYEIIMENIDTQFDPKFRRIFQAVYVELATYNIDNAKVLEVPKSKLNQSL